MSQTGYSRLLSPLLGAYYFFYFALVGVYVIFMPKVLVELGYSTVEVGIVYAAAPFMRFLLPFLFRHFLELTPRVYLLSLLLSFIATLIFMGTVRTFEFYLVTNLLFGAAVGISLPYVETIALASLTKTSYGKVRLWGSLGFMGIALWLGKVLEVPFEALYYLSSMSFLTLLFGALLIRYDTTSHPAAKDDAAFSLSKYWAFWVSVFLMQVGFGGFYNFFTIYETSHGISLEMTSWMWSCHCSPLADPLSFSWLNSDDLYLPVPACHLFRTLPYCSHHLCILTLYPEKTCTTVLPGYRLWSGRLRWCYALRADLR